MSYVASVASSRLTEQSTLISGLRNRDPQSYQQLIDVYGPRMLAVARRILKCEADAADAVQEAYTAAIGSLERFEERASIWTWLHRIVVNASLMLLRRRRRRPETSLDELLPKFSDDGHHLHPVADWTSDAPARLSREEVRSQVRACIDRLPNDYRTIVLLRDIEGLDTTEAAQLLGVTRAVVKTRLHRARQALRPLLGTALTQQTGLLTTA